MYYERMQDEENHIPNRGLSDFEQWNKVLTEPPGWVFLVFIALFTVGLFLAGGPITLVGMAAALFMMYKLFNYVKSHQRSEVTLGALIRYFNWACILLVAYLIGMVHWSFMSCYSLVLLINIYFFCTAETTHEGFLKFFFIYPIAQHAEEANRDHRRKATWVVVDTLSDCDWYLWIARLFFMALALGATAVSVGKIRVKPEEVEHAISAFASAGFCEELYKFLFTGTVSAISLYSHSRVAVLQLSVASAAGFTLMEDILYALNSGLVTLIVRLLFFPLHICFNQVTALGVARQRRTWGSYFEIFVCFFAGVALHGAYDYMLFLQNPPWLFLISIGVVAPLTCWCGHCAWSYGVRDLGEYPKMVEDEREIRNGQLSSDPNLPGGWEILKDEGGSIFYVNRVTETTQSSRPVDSSLPDGWCMDRKANGAVVFVDPHGDVHSREAMLQFITGRV